MSGANELLERMRSYQGSAGEPDETTLARREVAGELRALLHSIGASQASPQQLRDVAAQLRVQGEVLAEAGEIPEDSPRSSPATVPGMEDFHDRSPIAGRSNPMAPPAILGVDPDAAIVVGVVTFGPAFEGAPGIVHGGFVAAVLDEALGMASALSGTPCMTAELTTRYRRHTPVGTPLRIEARLLSAEGRKVLTSGEVTAGGDVLAEGHGLFIAVDTEKFQQLASAKSGVSGS